MATFDPTVANTDKTDEPYDYGAPTVFGGDLGRPPRFRFEVLRKPANWEPPGGNLLSDAGVTKWDLTNVEDCSWSDALAVMTGSITLRDPYFGDDGAERGLDQGDRVRCYATTPGGEEALWTMRVNRPQFTGSTLTRTFDLANDLDLLVRSEGYFHYSPKMSGTGKSSKKRWTGGEVITDVCRMFQMPVSEMYETDYSIGTVHMKRGSPLEVIRAVVDREHKHHKLRLVVRLGPLGGLHVMPLVRNTRLRALGPTLIDAAYEAELHELFGTVLTLHGIDELVDPNKTVDKTGKLKGKPTPSAVVVPSGGIHSHSAAVNRYGYVHRIMFAGAAVATTAAELKEIADAALVAIQKPVRKITLTSPGIVGINRGDAIQIGYRATGENKIIVVFVKEASYQVTTGGFTMQLLCLMDDPYIDNQGEELLKRLRATSDEISDVVDTGDKKDKTYDPNAADSLFPPDRREN